LRGAVNVPALGAKELLALTPYIELSEKLGRFQAQLADGPVREVKLEFSGELAELNGAPVTRAFLAGLLRDVSARVNAVNALLIAEERGIKVTTSYSRGADFVPAIRSRVAGGRGERSICGTMFGLGEQQREGRITEIDGFHIEAVPQGHMVVMHNQDVPGVIGKVGTIFGERGVNISRFHLGRRERGGEAMAVIEVDASLQPETLDQLRSLPPVISAIEIEL
jgi:D-3-phosphoglycerate dehydrogenase